MKLLNRILKVIGYGLALIPLIGSAAIVINYWLFIPAPVTPPNITLRGTEIIIPVFFGVLFSAVCFIVSLFLPQDKKHILWIWMRLAMMPFFILLLFLWVIVPLMGS